MTLKIKEPNTVQPRLKQSLDNIRSDNMCKLTIGIPKTLNSRFKIKAEQNSTNMTNVLLEYIYKYINKGYNERERSL